MYMCDINRASHSWCVGICVTWLSLTCHSNHSYVWHDIHMCDMTQSYVWHDSFICVTYRAPHSGDAWRYVWHDSFIRATWLIYMWHDVLICLIWLCDMTNSYVAWSIGMFHMTHSYVWHDSYVWYNAIMCDMTHAYVWHDSCIYMTWLTDMWHAWFLSDPSPPSEVFSRNGLLSSLCSCCCCYCHTHTRASICTCSQTCARRTFSHICTLTHTHLTCAHMQTHIDTWKHTKTQVIDTKDIDIDVLVLDFVTNHSLNAE